MASNIIEEFLVSIGVKYDNASVDQALNKAGTSVQNLGKKLTGGGKGGVASKIGGLARSLGGGAAAEGLEVAAAAGGPVGVVVSAIGLAAVAVGAAAKLMEATVAKSFEQLYFKAQLAGTSTQALKGLEYGFTQIGLGADTAAQAVTNIGLALKFNPGSEGLFASLGIQMRTANGQLRDNTDIFNDFLDRLASMPPYLAAAYAAMFGISAQTLLMLENNRAELKAAQQSFQETAQRMGVDLNKLGDKSHTFMVAWRRMWMALELLWDRVATAILPAVTTAVNVLDDAIERLPDAWHLFVYTITSTYDVLRSSISDAIGGIEKGFQSLMDWFKSSGLEAAFVDTFKRIAASVTEIFAGVVNTIKGAFTSVIDAITSTITNLFNKLASTSGGRWIMRQLGVAVDAAASVGSSILNGAKTAGTAALEYMYHSELGAEGRGGLGPLNSITPDVGSPSGNSPLGATLGIRNNNPGNLRSGSGQIGTNGGFAVFRSAVDGLAAMRDNLIAYGRQGYDTIASIVNRWAPPSDNNSNNGAYMATIAKILGVDANAHLNLNDPSVLSGLMRGITQFENGGNPYSVDLINRVAGSASGQSGAALVGPRVSMNQSTTINVNGAGDPTATATAVAGKQRGVNQDITRWMQGAVLG
jgi:hypothetical protein